MAVEEARVMICKAKLIFPSSESQWLSIQEQRNDSKHLPSAGSRTSHHKVRLLTDTSSNPTREKNDVKSRTGSADAQNAHKVQDFSMN